MGQKKLSEQARAKGSELGPAGKRVLAYIEQNPVAALASSAAELAAKSSTSDATVVRTIQALGFTGIAELKRALVAANAAATPADDMRRTLAEMAESASAAMESVLRIHDEGLAVLRRNETQVRLASAALALEQASRIVVFGIGPTAGLGRYVATLLRRSGRRSCTLDCTGSMLADQLLDLSTGDALLVLAYGRPYREVEAVFAAARDLRLPIVLITDLEDSKLPKLADCVVVIPRGRPGQVALHGVTLVALEGLVLTLSATRSAAALSSLDRLAELRRALDG